MLKIIDKDQCINVKEEQNSTIICYCPSFSKNIKIIRSVMLFDSAIFSKTVSFDVLINEKFIKNVKLDFDSKKNVCFDFTDIISDCTKNKDTCLCIKFSEKLKLVQKDSIKIIYEYLPLKFCASFEESNKFFDKKIVASKLGICSVEDKFAFKETKINNFLEFVGYKDSKNNFKIEADFNKDKLVLTTSSLIINAKVIFEYQNGCLLREKLLFDNATYQNNYYYNKHGMLVRKIDYSGMVEDYEYNGKGKITKISKYYMLDASSKFVNYLNLNAFACPLQSYNAFGETKETFGYYGDTNILASKQDNFNNKTCFGYNPITQKLNSISLSVDDEENCNLFEFDDDHLTKLSHNNFDIKYSFDNDEKLSKISIAEKDYLVNKYLKNNGIITSYANGEELEKSYDKKGNLIKVVLSNGNSNSLVLQNAYDNNGNLIEATEEVYNKKFKCNYAYNKLGKLAHFAKTYIGIHENSANSCNDIEIKNSYNKFGKLVLENLKLDGNLIENKYIYDNGIAGKLEGIEFFNRQHQKIEYDCLNRIQNICIGNKLCRHFNFAKKGEHCSTLVASEWFGEDGIIKDSFKYIYDSKGNVTNICENGIEITRLTYDSINRLVREDNKKLDLTTLIDYDKGGNIVRRVEYPYSLKSKELLDNGTIINYNYRISGWKDRLFDYNGEKFVYDKLGNPIIYRDKKLVWGNIKNLERFENDISFEYDSNGIRTSKIILGKTTKFFYNKNKIVLQDNGNKLYFHYGIDGVAGFTHVDCGGFVRNFYYKKNIFGDIISIYDDNFLEIVRYTYDAWGNHRTQILADDGKYIELYLNRKYSNIEQNNKFVAEINPFRYRGYYYDNEINLYYVGGRYYDPEIGRFVCADNIEILNISQNLLNGLNLFCYCLNNPFEFYNPN